MVNKNCSSYINDIRCSGLNTIHFITVTLTKGLFISLLSLILDIGEQFFRLSFANARLLGRTNSDSGTCKGENVNQPKYGKQK